MTTTASGIRAAHHVPAKVGGRIAHTDSAGLRRLGRIVGFRAGLLRVRYDGDPKVYGAHPTRGIEYLSEPPAPADPPIPC